MQLTSTQTGNGTFRSVAGLRIPAVTYPLAARSCPVMDFGNWTVLLYHQRYTGFCSIRPLASTGIFSLTRSVYNIYRMPKILLSILELDRINDQYFISSLPIEINRINNKRQVRDNPDNHKKER